MRNDVFATEPELPDLSSLIEIPTEQVASLIDLRGDATGNRFFIDHEFAYTHIPAIEIHGTGHLIYMGRGCNMRGIVRFHGEGAQAWLFGGGRFAELDATIYDGGKLVWGRDSGTYGMRVWVHGGKALVVGEDCLFSGNIEIRTSDHHSIVDLASGEQVNHPADVVIGRHVWIAPSVMIQKGVTIGDGSIIGTGAVVTSHIPHAESWAGVPARRISSQVSWTDSYPPNPAEVASLRLAYQMDARGR